MRFLRLCLVVAVAFILFLISQILLEVYLENDPKQSFSLYTNLDDTSHFKEVTEPVILWWAPLGGGPSTGNLRQCGELSCYFTSNHLFRHHPQTKAYMFYGSTINFNDLPLPRNGSTMLWALLHEESPRNTAPLSHQAAITLFNYTATFSRLSSFPLTTQYLGNLHTLTVAALQQCVGETVDCFFASVSLPRTSAEIDSRVSPQPLPPASPQTEYIILD